MNPGLAFALGALFGAAWLEVLRRMERARPSDEMAPWHLAYALVVVVVLVIGSAVTQ